MLIFVRLQTSCAIYGIAVVCLRTKRYAPSKSKRHIDEIDVVAPAGVLEAESFFEDELSAEHFVPRHRFGKSEDIIGSVFS